MFFSLLSGLARPRIRFTGFSMLRRARLAKFSIDFRPQPGTEAVEADIKRHLDALRQVIPPGHALGYFTQATSRNGPMGPTVECTVRCIIYKNLS